MLTNVLKNVLEKQKSLRKRREVCIGDLNDPAWGEAADEMTRRTIQSALDKMWFKKCHFSGPYFIKTPVEEDARLAIKQETGNPLSMLLEQ